MDNICKSVVDDSVWVGMIVWWCCVVGSVVHFVSYDHFPLRVV